MSAGKVIGGLLALVGGVFILIGVVLRAYEVTSGVEGQLIRWIINLVVCLFAIIGGLMAMASKGGAGGLVLIAGILAFLMPLIAVLIGSSDMSYWFYGYSGLDELTGWGRIAITDGVINWTFPFEAFLIFLGAIFILNSRDN